MIAKFIMFFGSSSLLAGVQLGGAVLVARTQGGATFASFVLAQAIATPVAMFFNFGLRQYLSTDASHAVSIHTAMVLKVIAAVVGVLAGAIAVIAFPAYFYGWEALFLLSLIYKLTEGALELQIGALQRDQNFYLISKLLLFKTFLYGSSFAVGQLVYSSVKLSILLCIIGTMVAVCLLHRSSGSTSESPLELRKMFQKVFPLGLGALAVAGNANVPRILVESIGAQSFFVLFAAMLQIAAPMILLLNIACQFLLPGLATLFATGGFRKFRRRVFAGYFIVLGVSLGAAGFLMEYGRQIVSWVYGFDHSVPIADASSIGVFVGATLLAGYSNYVFTSLRRFGRQLFVSMSTMVTLCLIGYASHSLSVDASLALIVISSMLAAQSVVLLSLSLYLSRDPSQGHKASSA